MTLGIFKQGSVYDKFLIRLAVRGHTPTVHFQFLFWLFYTACFPTCEKYESFSGIVGIQNIQPGIQSVMSALLAENNGNYHFPRFSSVVWRLCMSLGQIYVLHGV